MRGVLRCGLVSAATFFLIAVVFSCAHSSVSSFDDLDDVSARESRTKRSAPLLPVGTTIAIRGAILEVGTGNAVPYASVYVVDMRPDTWGEWGPSSARLGTANRNGEIDLAITWRWESDLRIDPPDGPHFAGIGRKGEQASDIARTPEGKSKDLAIVVVPESFGECWVLLDTAKLAQRDDEGIVLDIGKNAVERVPELEWDEDEPYEFDIEGTGNPVEPRVIAP